MGEYIAALALWSPQSFEDADDAERAAVCNGLGPRGWGWAVPDRIMGLSVTPAGDIHDWQYSEAHTHSDRLQADLTFLRNMIVIIMKRDIEAGWWEKRLTYMRLCRALKYFLGVWRFGGSFMN